MNRREFLSGIPGAIKQTCWRALPEVRHLGWLKRVLGARSEKASHEVRVIAIDDSHCPACGGAECTCVRLTTE